MKGFTDIHAHFVYGVDDGAQTRQDMEAMLDAAHADKVACTMEQYVDEYGIIHEVCGCPDFLTVGTSAESMAAYLMMHAWRKKVYR